MKTLITNYIAQIEEVQYGNPWVGNSYSKKLKNIDDQICFTQPLREIHSIAEIISHCTMWRNEAILKIETGIGTKTDDSKENWLPNSELKKKGWNHIYKEYTSSFEKFISTLSLKDDDFLKTSFYDIDFKKECTYQFLIDGMLHHDLYHLGQISLIRKLLQEK